MLPSEDEIYVRYDHERYLIRRKILKLFGGAFHIFGPDGELLFYSRQKAFKLKEDIRLYTDEQMEAEVLVIRARQAIDFSAAYDVFDPVANEVVGGLQRRGLKSMFRDEWTILGSDEQPLGVVKEDSVIMAMLRRSLSNLIPQNFQATVDGAPVGVYSQNFNPFLLKLNLDFSMDIDQRLDRRLGIAAAVLLCAIEGRQG